MTDAITIDLKEVCILLPTVNELENLRILIPDLLESLKGVSVLVIDDGSTDGSLEYLTAIQVKYPEVRVVFRNVRLGIGSAHLLGLAEAKRANFRFLLTMDADLTHLVNDAKRVLYSMKNYDLVIGSRYLGQADIHGWSKQRIFLTHFGHQITSKFFGSEIDMSSGLRAYRLETLPLHKMNDNCPTNYEFFFIFCWS